MYALVNPDDLFSSVYLMDAPKVFSFDELSAKILKTANLRIGEGGGGEVTLRRCSQIKIFRSHPEECQLP